MAVDESPVLRAAVTGDIDTLEVLQPAEESSPETDFHASTGVNELRVQDAIAAGDDVEQLSATGCTPLWVPALIPKNEMLFVVLLLTRVVCAASLHVSEVMHQLFTPC